MPGAMPNMGPTPMLSAGKGPKHLLDTIDSLQHLWLQYTNLEDEWSLVEHMLGVLVHTMCN